MDENKITNSQFKGIIKMIISLIKNGTPTDEIVECLTELIKD